ncbi:MAG: hypothetical protein WBD07_11620 [Vicinamibacterales bacterium]
MRFVQKMWLCAWLLAALLACSGCFQISTLVTVNGDGSGTINQRVLFTSAALAQIRQFAALAGGVPQNFEPVSEQQARDAADTMGPGVTYVSSTPIDTPEGQGRNTTYAFIDINQLRLDAQPPSPGGLMGGAQGLGAATRATFSLTREPDGLATLRIVAPQLSLPGGRRIGPAGNVSPDQVAMVRPLLAGARLAMAVEPAGSLVRTSSPWVESQRVSIIDIEFDQFLNDDTLRRLQGARTVGEATAALKESPGVKINFDPEITIEFRGQ